MIIIRKHWYLSVYFWIIAISSLLVLSSIVHAVNRDAYATDGVVAKGEHIITVYDDGQKTGFMTRAHTMGEALSQAGIHLAPNDVTEPSVDQELVSSNYNVTIYRSRPILVIDGTSRTKVISAFHTGKQVAEQAGIELLDEDIADLEYSSDVVSDGALEKLVIKRATPLYLVLYGQKTLVHTQSGAIGDLLSEKHIDLTDKDRISVDPSAPIKSGMTIEIWREGKQTVTRKEVAHFSVRKVNDANRPVGYHSIQTPGENGEKIVTYEITVKNGKEVKKKAIQTVIVKEPSEQIEIIGTKYEGVSTTPNENQAITWDFLISQGFSKNQVAGIMGNLQQEHGFNTTGDGIAQWTGGRKANLMAREDPYSIYTQLQFMMDELNGPYSHAKQAIISSNTVEDATIAFQNKYEGCGICMEGLRIQFAYNFLASF